MPLTNDERAMQEKAVEDRFFDENGFYKEYIDIMAEKSKGLQAGLKNIQMSTTGEMLERDVMEVDRMKIDAPKKVSDDFSGQEEMIEGLAKALKAINKEGDAETIEDAPAEDIFNDESFIDSDDMDSYDFSDLPEAEDYDTPDTERSRQDAIVQAMGRNAEQTRAASRMVSHQDLSDDYETDWYGGDTPEELEGRELERMARQFDDAGAERSLEGVEGSFNNTDPRLAQASTGVSGAAPPELMQAPQAPGISQQQLQALQAAYQQNPQMEAMNRIGQQQGYAHPGVQFNPYR